MYSTQNNPSESSIQCRTISNSYKPSDSRISLKHTILPGLQHVLCKKKFPFVIHVRKRIYITIWDIIFEHTKSYHQHKPKYNFNLRTIYDLFFCKHKFTVEFLLKFWYDDAFYKTKYLPFLRDFCFFFREKFDNVFLRCKTIIYVRKSFHPFKCSF